MPVVDRMKGAAGWALERRYGIRTADAVHREELGYDEDHTWYEPSGWLMLPIALSGMRIGPHDVFVDIGCGKGRVVAQAATRYPFARVIGVELSPALCAAARQNAAALRSRRGRPPAEVVIEQADVLAWDMPDDVTLAYMFNPFRGEVFRSAVERIFASYDRSPRKLRIVYTNPHEHPALMATGRVREIAAPRGRLMKMIGFDATAVRRYEVLPA